MQYIEPVVEIFPERSPADFLVQVGIGGRDHPNIHGYVLLAADAAELAVFKQAEQTDLHFFVNGGELIQKNRSPISGFKTALAPTRGVGKSTAFMSEKLTGHQIRRQGADMHRNERCGGPRAQFVDGLGGKFFAGAGLTGEQYRDIRGRCLPDLAINLTHGGGAPHHAFKSGLFHFAAQHQIQTHLGFCLNGGFDEQFELFITDRQQGVVKNTCPQGLMGDLQPVGMGEKEDLCAGTFQRNQLQDLHGGVGFRIGHRAGKEHQVESFPLETVNHLVQAAFIGQRDRIFSEDIHHLLGQSPAFVHANYLDSVYLIAIHCI